MMGIIGDSIVEYAQPLLEQTDGSVEQMNKAMKTAQLCWNLALLPQEERDKVIAETQGAMGLDEAGFADFKKSVIDPMIARAQRNMPNMEPEVAPTPSRKEKYPGTGRNAPCPCGSGKKYKRCCGG